MVKAGIVDPLKVHILYLRFCCQLPITCSSHVCPVADFWSTVVFVLADIQPPLLDSQCFDCAYQGSSSATRDTSFSPKNQPLNI